MDKINNKNKLFEYVFLIALLGLLVFLADLSLLAVSFVPIILASVGLNYGFKEFFIGVAGTALIGSTAYTGKELLAIFIPLILVSLTFIGLFKSKLNFKNIILISFAILAIIFVSVYKIEMISEGYSIGKLAEELKEVYTPPSSYDIPIKTFETAIAMYPAVLSTLALAYSLLAIKLIANYLAHQGKGIDFSLNWLRLTKKDMAIVLVIAVVIFLIARFFKLNMTYVAFNLVFLILALLIANGISAYDYMMAGSSLRSFRLIQWFFIIMFFYFFAVFFVMFGIVDLFIDIRTRMSVGGRYER